MRQWGKIGVIAGAGDLPVQLAEYLRLSGASYFIARIEGISDPALVDHPGAVFGLGEMGARFRALKEANCDGVTFVGLVRRPNISELKLDGRATLMLPKVLAAARKGDDALMRAVLDEFEREGFRIVGPEEVWDKLLASEGALGLVTPQERDMEDIRKGVEVARALGAWDIGQGCVVSNGHVLAVEAAEGTDAMLARVAALAPQLIGSPDARSGVLVKCTKPAQDRRIDLPTIGVGTVDRAAAASLAGIAIEAGGALIADQAATIARADALGLFVFGIKV